MNNRNGSVKKVLVCMFLLMALAAAVAFAGELNGVQWTITDEEITLYNSNDYRVMVIVSRQSLTVPQRSIYVEAHETKVVPIDRIVEVLRVQRV